MACCAKTEGHATENQGENKADDGDAPSSGLGKNHKVAAHENLPADLQVKGQRAKERPHDTTPASKYQHSARRSTDAQGVHVIGGDGIEALVRLSCERNDEAHLSQQSAIKLSV